MLSLRRQHKHVGDVRDTRRAYKTTRSENSGGMIFCPPTKMHFLGFRYVWWGGSMQRGGPPKVRSLP